jgi:hypothetical protein
MHDNENYILVNTITIRDLIAQYDIQNISILKLDIEGKEIDVIKDLIIKKIFPKQILVDFEGLFPPQELVLMILSVLMKCFYKTIIN